MCTPQHWNVDGLGRFMVCFGLISSVFDLATFGLMLLIISGFGLLHPYFSALAAMPWAIAKFVFVSVIACFSGFSLLQMRGIQQGNDVANRFKKLALAGKINLSASIATVICAVLAFH